MRLMAFKLLHIAWSLWFFPLLADWFVDRWCLALFFKGVGAYLWIFDAVVPLLVIALEMLEEESILPLQTFPRFSVQFAACNKLLSTRNTTLNSRLLLLK